MSKITVRRWPGQLAHILDSLRREDIQPVRETSMADGYTDIARNGGPVPLLVAPVSLSPADYDLVNSLASERNTLVLLPMPNGDQVYAAFAMQPTRARIAFEDRTDKVQAAIDAGAEVDIQD